MTEQDQDAGSAIEVDVQGEPTDTITFYKSNSEVVPLIVVSKEMGTVGIKLQQEFLRELMFTQEKATAAYHDLVTVIGAEKADMFHQKLHEILEGTINAFHRNVYARSVQAMAVANTDVLENGTHSLDPQTPVSEGGAQNVH